MRQTKKMLFTIFLVLSLLLTSCYFFAGEDVEEIDLNMVQAFDAFLQDEFLAFATANPIVLNSTIKHPENFGIDYIPITMEGALLEMMKGTQADFQERRAQFEGFNRESLTVEQRQSYDILAWQFALIDESLKNDFHYYRSAFESITGIHVSLPLILSHYHFNNKQDIEDYLFLLSEIGTVFDEALQHERARIEKGFYFSNQALREVLNACTRFLNAGEENFLFLSFQYRLSHIDFLNEVEKSHFSDRHEEVFAGYVIPAFDELIAELGSLIVAGQEELGLAHFGSGSEYYRFMLRSMGTDTPPDEWIIILTQWLKDIEEEYTTLLEENFGEFSRNHAEMFPFDNAEEMMTFLSDRAANYFPSFPEGTSYSIRRLDPIISVGGIYPMPQIDNYRINVFYYSEDLLRHRAAMYSVIAHEGTPGHMLQFVTVYANPLSDFRKANTAGFTTNIEGWATYAHLFSFNFLEISDADQQRFTLEDKVIWVLYSLIDVGVNYRGWTFAELMDHLAENELELRFAIMSRANLRIFYGLVIRNPFLFLPYGIGLWEMQSLKEYMEDHLGDCFDIKVFHETFLNLGFAPFPLVREWMREELLGCHYEDRAIRQMKECACL